MSRKLKIKIPELPPSINHYYGRTKYGNIYLSNDAKVWRDYVTTLCLAQKIKPIKGWVKVHVTYFTKNKRIMDLDNRKKALFDSLNGKAWLDDRYILEYSTKRIFSRGVEATVVTVEETREKEGNP